MKSVAFLEPMIYFCHRNVTKIFFMPYDFTSLQTYLEDNHPEEVVSRLDSALYDLVLSAEYLESVEGLASRYLDMLLLRNEFAILAGLPIIKPDVPWI